MELSPFDSSSTMYTCRVNNPSLESMGYGDFYAFTNLDIVNYFSSKDGQIDPASFIKYYCSNQLEVSGCPAGICPNPDIAGMLLRIARKFSSLI
jgi:hypothetical protein